MPRTTTRRWEFNRTRTISDLGLDPTHEAVEFHDHGFVIGYWIPLEWSGQCPDSKLAGAAPELLAALEEIVRNVQPWKTCDNMAGRLFEIASRAIEEAVDG